MRCEHVCEFLDAYIDKELDVIRSAEFEQHLEDCAECRTRYGQHAQIHELVQTRGSYFRAPDDFRRRLRTHLYPVESVKVVPGRPLWLLDRRVWSIAAMLAVVLLSSLLFVGLLRQRSASQVLAEQVVSSHIRSLLANHLSDVVSTDQHTVKPWFTGKVDFAPIVKDLSQQGFPLIGGRLDYLDNRSVAALVYKRRQHTINLFVWPSAGSDAGLRQRSLRGYNMVYWTHAHMTFWAVSDVNAVDLDEFARGIGS